MIQGRRRGEVANYQMSSTNEVKTINAGTRSLPETSDFNGLIMCPYTPMIPMIYAMGAEMGFSVGRLSLFFNSSLIRQLIPAGLTTEQVEQLKAKQSAHRFSSVALRAFQQGLPINTDTILKQIREGFILLDKPTGLISDGWPVHSKVNAKHRLSGENMNGRLVISKLSFRSYSGEIAPLTVVLDEEHNKRPVVMGAILPENYLYQKYHILKHGTIDLEKCVVLVDRELDSVDFPLKNFRDFYRKEIEPWLKTLAAPVWKVSQDFIKEQCFVNRYQIKTKNIIQRKKEIGELVEGFYTYFTQPTGGRVNTPQEEMSLQGLQDTAVSVDQVV